MRRILEWVRSERLDRLVLHASLEGRALYDRLGFKTTGESLTHVLLEWVAQG